MPPKPYTEGDLIKIMKNAGKKVDDEADKEILKEVEGLGADATRSGIIETIKKNGYIEVKKNIVSITNKGKILCQAIEGTLLSSPVMTAKWEGELKKIGEGQGSQEELLQNIKNFIVETIEDAPKKIGTDKVALAVKEQQNAQFVGKCPICGGGIVEKKGYFGCSKYPDCKFTLSDNFRKKKLTKANIKNLLEGKETTVEGIKKADKTTYNAVVRLNEKGFIDFYFIR